MVEKKIEVKLKKEIEYSEYARLKRLAKNGIIEMIKTAIDYKWQLEINYNNNEVRIVNPHCYFFNSKSKNFLSGFQIKGFSKSENVSNSWKTFAIEKITDCKISTPIVEFTIEKTFNPNYKGYGNTNVIVTKEGMKATDNS